MLNKRLINTGEEATFDPLQNFETVAYTGNGGTQKITGYIRKGAAFNGSSSYINLNNTNSLGLSDIRTVSVWIKTTSTSGSTIYAIGQTGISNAYAWFSVSSQSDGKIQAGYCQSNGGWRNAKKASFATNDNNWHNITFVTSGDYTNGGGTLYIDGQEDTSATTVNDVGSAISVFTGTSTIGRYSSQNINYFNGSIDQVRIFDKAISSSEVTTLYNETYASSTKSTTDIFGDSSGVALYELDEDANDTGGTYNGTPTNVNFLGMAFQPDLVWLKGRNNASWNHFLQDSIRGAENFLISSLTNAEATTLPHIVDSFDTNGFTVLGNGNSNTNGDTYVAWCWKAGGVPTPNNNTQGTITSTVSANPDAGFSIVSYTGNGLSNQTIGHGLGKTPDMIITKGRANLSTYDGWDIWHKNLTLNHILGLHTTAAETATPVNSRFVTSLNSDTVFGVGPDIYGPNSSGTTKIAYCFHSVDGYQKIGSYTGNGSTTGPIITTGFKPRFILTKPSSIADNWSIWDNVREAGDTIDQILVPNNSGAESADGFGRYDIDLLDDGFQIKRTDAQINQNGATYIYLAIA